MQGAPIPDALLLGSPKLSLRHLQKPSHERGALTGGMRVRSLRSAFRNNLRSVYLDQVKSIRHAVANHFKGLRSALDTVAREKRFLAFTQAPPEEEAFAFYRSIVAGGGYMSVAVLDGQVVGWCDVLSTHGQARSPVGTLGIALIPSARHLGIGAKLMGVTIAAAWCKGFTRIELTVRADNKNAKALYERLGFETEGIMRRAFQIDGAYSDCYSMALLKDLTNIVFGRESN
jgi:RimJ/RimL family protein N-acetyltransferase